MLMLGAEEIEERGARGSDLLMQKEVAHEFFIKYPRRAARPTAVGVISIPMHAVASQARARTPKLRRMQPTNFVATAPLQCAFRTRPDCRESNLVHLVPIVLRRMEK